MLDKLILDDDSWRVVVAWAGAGKVTVTYKPMGAQRATLPAQGKRYLLAVLEELTRRGHGAFGNEVLARCVADIACAFLRSGWQAEALRHEFSTTPIPEVVRRRL